MEMIEIPLEKIKPPKHPLRFGSGDENIGALAGSIRACGLLCPLLVRAAGEGYELVSGRRRLAALKALKAASAWAVVLESGLDPLAAALAENVLAAEISPLERALALAELAGRHSLEELGAIVGRDPGYIALHLRLLEGLHPEILKLLREEKITFGHAQALKRLRDGEKQRQVAGRILRDGLGVQETKLAVDQERPEGELNEREKELNRVEREIIAGLGEDWRSRVSIRQGKESEKLLIDFTGLADLKELLRKLGKILS